MKIISNQSNVGSWPCKQTRKKETFEINEKNMNPTQYKWAAHYKCILMEHRHNKCKLWLWYAVICLQSGAKSKPKIFNTVGEKTFITVRETGGFILKMVFCYLSVIVMLFIYLTFTQSVGIITPEWNITLLKTLCFTLSCSQSRGCP